MATSDSIYDELEFEGIKFKSNGTMGFADEEYPGIKGDALLKLLPDLAVQVDRHCLDCQHRWRNQIVLDLGGMETEGQE